MISGVTKYESVYRQLSEVKKQRAELLEALKDVMSAVELGWIPDGESMFNAREAITKAEAVE